MSWFARRLKAITGCSATGIPSVAAVTATPLRIPDGAYDILVSSVGATTIPSLIGVKSPGRTIRLHGESNQTLTFTNTGAAATEGQMDLGAGDATVAQTDILTLTQMNNGHWKRSVAVVDN